MPKVTFFPLGNADSCRIDLSNDKKLLFDYAHMRTDDGGDKRCDLPQELRRDLGQRDYFDVLAITHLDNDHINGSSEFFWLQHAQKYQGDDRIKINELWVPAAVITEEGCTDEARIMQSEARYRLQKKTGIRVFSRPQRLQAWLENNGMKLEDVRHLVTDAGQVVPGFDKQSDGIEFFAHSPFAKRLNEADVEDRNADSLVLQATFLVGGVETKAILSADTVHEIWQDIVNITKYHGRTERLEWDIFKLPHHCSYLTLGPEKGDNETQPVAEVKWLYEEQGQRGGIVISTSEPMPQQGSACDEDCQPPHREAANYYKRICRDKDGEFIVTMEHPKIAAPEPIIVEIDAFKARALKRISYAGAAAIVQRAPRAG